MDRPLFSNPEVKRIGDNSGDLSQKLTKIATMTRLFCCVTRHWLFIFLRATKAVSTFQIGDGVA
jgi:hypothetical protein